MYSFVINTINALIRGLGYVLSAFTSVLPASPLSLLDSSSFKPYLGMVNYFVAVNELIVFFEAWSIACLTYMAYSVVLRWIKTIS